MLESVPSRNEARGRTMASEIEILDQLRQAMAQAQRGGLTQYRLAERAGVDRATVLRLSRGEGVTTLRTAARLADELGLELTLKKRRKNRK